MLLKYRLPRRNNEHGAPKRRSPGYNDGDMVIRYQWLSVMLVACAFSAFAATVHAQFGLPGTNGTISIAFSPTSPKPGDTVHLTVQSSLLDVLESDILWEADGKKIAQGKGADSTSLKAGALGTETPVDVTVITTEGTAVSARVVIVPTELDLLVDSDSYTPPFYHGRPLASAGTNLHLQAVPRFKRAGVSIPSSALTYMWRRNGMVLGSISGLGRSTAILPVEHLFGTDTISVEVRSGDGVLSHTSSVSLFARDPVLTLYQDHPLYGVMYHRALGPSTFIPETEMTFTAIPLFAQATSVYDPALNFVWHVNGAEIPTNRENPGKITINAENSSGIAFVELETTHATNYFLNAKDRWNVTFSSSPGAVDLFQSANQ